MSRTHVRGWSVLLAASLQVASGSASAGGFAVGEQSAVAGGTGGASTARSDDAGAAWYNPAALADNGGLRVGVGVMFAAAALRAEAMDGSWNSDSESSLATPPQLQLSVARDNLAYGISVGVPFGGGVTWPADWRGRHEIISSKLEVVRAAPFLAMRLGKLQVAAGVHADFGRLRIQRGLDFVDTEGHVDLDMDGRSFGVDVSAFYSVSRALDIGASYKSRGSLALSGGANFEAPDAFDTKTADQNVGTSVELPDRVALGAAWKRDRIAFFGDIELTTWGVYRELRIDFERDETPDPVQTTGWRRTVAIRVGAELQLDARTQLRAGGFVDPSPAPANRLAPSSPDSTRLGASTGLSRVLKGGLSLDAFYTYMQLLKRASDSMDDLPARYGGHVQLLGVALRLQR